MTDKHKNHVISPLNIFNAHIQSAFGTVDISYTAIKCDGDSVTDIINTGVVSHTKRFNTNMRRPTNDAETYSH